MGGQGNVAEFFAVADLVTAEYPWKRYFPGFSPTWRFCSDREYERLLQEAGFVVVRAELITVDMVHENRFGLHDPPLNMSNIQGVAGSQYWTINESGYYPVDWFTTGMSQVLTTTNPFAILIQASNVVLDGMGLIINGAANSGIVVNDSSRNVMVTNFTVMEKTTGVLFDGVTYDATVTSGGDLATGGMAAPVPNEISNVNANYNTNGIWVKNSNNVTLTGNSANNNEIDGIHLEGSNNNNLTGNTATGNGPVSTSLEEGRIGKGISAGFLLQDGYGNELVNNTATGNDYGFALYNSSNNNLTGNTITGNSIGILLEESYDNILHTNLITGNSEAGISLDESYGNTIYNNYFNNINNVVVPVTSSGELSKPGSGNVWNTTKTPGQNIIGGPFLGGNYWADPAGTGWSQTHYDIGDGFTVPYDVIGAGLNVDQYPLTLLSPEPIPPGPYPPSPVIPVPPGLVWGAAFTANTFPATICTCGSAPVTVTVNNTGTTGWLEHDVELGAYNDAATRFSPVNVPLDPDTFVSPGHPYTFSFTLQAPCTPGTYDLQYRLVKNNGEWFGDTLDITVVVQTCGQVKAAGTSVSGTAKEMIERRSTIVDGPATVYRSHSGQMKFASLHGESLERYGSGEGTNARSMLLSRLIPH